MNTNTTNMNNTNMNTNDMNMSTNDTNMSDNTNINRIKVDRIPMVDIVDLNNIPIDENSPIIKGFNRNDGPSLEETVMSGWKAVEAKMKDLKLIDDIFDVLWRVGEYKDPVKKVKRVIADSRADSWEKINELVDGATGIIQKRIESKIGEYPQIEVMEYDKNYDCSVPTYYPDDEKMPEWRDKERKEWRKLYSEWAKLVALKLDMHVRSRRA